MACHHGRLDEAFVDAALATARVEGPDAVVLRAATRGAGVSPNAAHRHFADSDELLGAVAGRCMAALAELIEKRLAGLPEGRDTAALAWQRLRAAGRAQPAESEVVVALESLVDPDSRGDPESPLRWTTGTSLVIYGNVLNRRLVSNLSGAAASRSPARSTTTASGRSPYGASPGLRGGQHRPGQRAAPRSPPGARGGPDPDPRRRRSRSPDRCAAGAPRIREMVDRMLEAERRWLPHFGTG